MDGIQPATHGPSKNRKLTQKRQKRLVEAAIKGEPLKEVAISLGYSPKSAETQAHHIVQKAQGNSSFVRTLEAHGLTDDFLAEKAKELLDADNHHFFAKDGVVTDERTSPAHETRRKTLEMIGKFKGHMQDKSAVDVQVGLMQVVVNTLQSKDK
jgi:DNA-binding CsgD family transcriptional regulator